MSPTHHLTVRFDGDGMPLNERGPFLLALERWCRHYTGYPIEVFLDRMPDDSKLRNAVGEKRRRDMTDKERASL